MDGELQGIEYVDAYNIDLRTHFALKWGVPLGREWAQKRK